MRGERTKYRYPKQSGQTAYQSILVVLVRTSKYFEFTLAISRPGQEGAERKHEAWVEPHSYCVDQDSMEGRDDVSGGGGGGSSRFISQIFWPEHCLNLGEWVVVQPPHKRMPPSAPEFVHDVLLHSYCLREVSTAPAVLLSV